MAMLVITRWYIPRGCQTGLGRPEFREKSFRNNSKNHTVLLWVKTSKNHKFAAQFSDKSAHCLCEGKKRPHHCKNHQGTCLSRSCGFLVWLVSLWEAEIRELTELTRDTPCHFQQLPGASCDSCEGRASFEWDFALASDPATEVPSLTKMARPRDGTNRPKFELMEPTSFSWNCGLKNVSYVMLFDQKFDSFHGKWGLKPATWQHAFLYELWWTYHVTDTAERLSSCL